MNYTEEYLNDLHDATHRISLESLCEKTILITGASGLIGSTIADALMYANDSYGCNNIIHLAGRSKDRIQNRFDTRTETDAYTYVKYDAETGAVLHCEYDYIIHCAANAHPSAYSQRPVETMVGCVNGLNVLLNTIRKQGRGRLVYVSSSEVYGSKENSIPYKEEDYGYVDISNPRACYPSAKRACETLCSSYNYEYGVDYVVVRPGHIYGPSITQSDSRAHAQFARSALAKKNIVMKSKGLQMRSYCYSVDCASAILFVMINGENGGAYNISGDCTQASIRELAEAFAVAGNVKIIYEEPTTQELNGYNLMENSSLDGEKISNLGWVPKIDIINGCRKTLEVLNASEYCASKR